MLSNSFFIITYLFIFCQYKRTKVITFTLNVYLLIEVRKSEFKTKKRFVPRFIALEFDKETFPVLGRVWFFAFLRSQCRCFISELKQQLSKLKWPQTWIS